MPDKQPGYKNLKRGRWKKGESGNPKGRTPKDVNLTSLLKTELDKVPSFERKGRTWRELIVLSWLKGSLKNPTLLFEMLNRLEGRPVQPIQLDIRREVERIALENNLDATELLKEAELIFKGAKE